MGQGKAKRAIRFVILRFPGFFVCVAGEVYGLNKRSGFFVWLCVALSCTAFTLMGCGKNYYFAGRGLPPSQLTNRVMIAVQNPSPFAGGAMVFVDAYYDIRHSYNNKVAGFAISGFSGTQPATIQNIPEHQTGAVYNAGSGTFVLVDYGKESANPAIGGLAGQSTSIFITQNLQYVFAASQSAHVLTVIDRTAGTELLPEPAGNLSSLGEPQRLSRAGVFAEQRRCVQRGAFGIEPARDSGCAGLRAAEFAGVLRCPGAGYEAQF